MNKDLKKKVTSTVRKGVKSSAKTAQDFEKKLEPKVKGWIIPAMAAMIIFYLFGHLKMGALMAVVLFFFLSSHKMEDSLMKTLDSLEKDDDVEDVKVKETPKEDQDEDSEKEKESTKDTVEDSSETSNDDKEEDKK